MSTPREIGESTAQVLQRNLENFQRAQERVQAAQHTLNELSELVAPGEDEAIDFQEMEVVEKSELELRLQARQAGVPVEQMEDVRDRHGPPPSGPQPVEDEED